MNGLANALCLAKQTQMHSHIQAPRLLCKIMSRSVQERLSAGKAYSIRSHMSIKQIGGFGKSCNDIAAAPYIYSIGSTELLVSLQLALVHGAA